MDSTDCSSYVKLVPTWPATPVTYSCSSHVVFTWGPVHTTYDYQTAQRQLVHCLRAIVTNDVCEIPL